MINSSVAERILQTASLPTPLEQADRFIRWLGAELPDPGDIIGASDDEAGAIIGTISDGGFGFVIQGLISAGLLEGHLVTGGASVTLTFAGWERYEALRRGAPSGRNAFMAMQYGDPVLDSIVTNYFRPAVKQTGFDLKRLDDEPKAGPIDARLMLEIKAAWFVIADLTHGNQGAYWEAGYAAGLAKPVFTLVGSRCGISEKPISIQTTISMFMGLREHRGLTSAVEGNDPLHPAGGEAA